MATNRQIKAHAAGYLAARKGEPYLAHRSGRRYKEPSENSSYLLGWTEGIDERKLLDASLASSKISRVVTEGLPHGWRIEVNGDALRATSPLFQVSEFLGRPTDPCAAMLYELCMGLSMLNGQSKPEDIVVNPNQTPATASDDRFAAKKFHAYKKDGTYLGEVSEFDVKGARRWASFVFQVPADQIGVSDTFLTPEQVATNLPK